MVILREGDAALLFADYLKQIHANKNFFSGAVTIQVNTIEIIISYQIFTDPDLYYELEYIATSNGIERESKCVIMKTSFENRFNELITYFFFMLWKINLDEARNQVAIELLEAI